MAAVGNLKGPAGNDGTGRIIVSALPALADAVEGPLYVVRNAGQPDYIWFKGHGAGDVVAWLQYFPQGGAVGQVLVKQSANDFDIAWRDPPPKLSNATLYATGTCGASSGAAQTTSSFTTGAA